MGESTLPSQLLRISSSSFVPGSFQTLLLTPGPVRWPCLATQHAIATRQPNYTELRDTNNATAGLGSGLRAVLEQSCVSRESEFGEEKR